MFAYVRSVPVIVDEDENLPPLVSKTGIVHEHGTMGARYAMNCHCQKCNAYRREYQRQWRRQQTAQRASNGELTKAHIWRRGRERIPHGRRMGTLLERGPGCGRSA